MAERQGQSFLVKQTRQFIGESPSVVAFLRSTRTDDGAGGTTVGAPTALGPQTVRLIPANPSTSAEVRTVSGETLKTQYSIVALPDADIREGDALLINGARHEVAIGINIGGYELRAEVVRRG